MSFLDGFEKIAHVKEGNALTRYMAIKSPKFAEILAKNKSRAMAPHKMKQWKQNAVSMFSGKNVPDLQLKKLPKDRGAYYDPKNTKPTKAGVPRKSGKVVMDKKNNIFRSHHASTFLHERGHHDSFMRGGMPAVHSETKAWDEAIQRADRTGNKNLKNRMLRDARTYTHGSHKFPGVEDKDIFFNQSESEQLKAGLAGKMKTPEMRKLQREFQDKKRSATSSINAPGQDPKHIIKGMHQFYKSLRSKAEKKSLRKALIKEIHTNQAKKEDVARFGSGNIPPKKQ